MKLIDRFILPWCVCVGMGDESSSFQECNTLLLTLPYNRSVTLVFSKKKKRGGLLVCGPRACLVPKVAKRGHCIPQD